MKTFSATSRVTFGLICLSISVWLLAFTLGMLPDRDKAVLEGRTALCENVALNASLLASRGDQKAIEAGLKGLVQRHGEVQSAAIRRPDGTLITSVGNHEGRWSLPPGTESTASQMRVPVLSGDTEWGTVEVRFLDGKTKGVFGWFWHPLLILPFFVGSVSALLFSFYLRNMLQHLDPSRVIPQRVRQTLDTLAEGLLVFDKHERILLANRSFAECVGASADELIGRNAAELSWESDDARLKIEGYPWTRAIRDGESQLDELLRIRTARKQQRVLKVSAAPIFGDDGQQRGALASFDDVTHIEQSRVELRQMLESLSQSRDEIQRQNLELERLAARDALTGCLNRRAFFTELENQWSTSERHDYPLACVMVDLDDFKAVNDTYGHQTGDQVLQKAAEVLRHGRRPSDLVCRYGGEEFCVLLPHADINAACIVAEQIRSAIAETDYNGVNVTGSLGISVSEFGAGSPQELIDQADKSLYVAKREGRNRVIRFDEAGEQIAEFNANSETMTSRNSADWLTAEENRDPAIPFHAVTALVSALAYRDPATADHSRKVADLCVATARRLMPVGESYILEIAALLHDIGKIGVPDSILLKPGKLTDEEWQVMNSHERIGVEIVQSTFSSPKLAQIILTYRSWFSGDPRHPDLPTGENIPLAARILAIADAYNSMTSQRSYREPLSRDQAFAELRRCAVRQFDPDLVETFVDTVLGRDADKATVADPSQAAALSFGTQIERLAEAFDNQDVGGIAALACRLNMTAMKYEVAEIAEVAAQLEEAADGESDMKRLVGLTSELLDLCRATQRSYLEQFRGRRSADDDETGAPSIDTPTLVLNGLADVNSPGGWPASTP